MAMIRFAIPRNTRGSCAVLATLCVAAGAFVGPAAAADFDCVMEPSLVVKLGSPVSSILSEVNVERGDVVQKGQVVARIESSVEQALVAANTTRAESTAEVEAKQALLDQKTAVIGRKSGLRQLNVTSNQDVENAQADFNVAKQEVELAKLNRRMAEIELRRSKASLEQRTIRSPIAGIVTQRALGPGEYVRQDGYIAVVARVDPLNVEAYLPVRYFGQVKVGQHAIVRPNEPVGGNRSADVSVVDQVFDAASGTFGVRLSLANPANDIPAGLRCRVSFDLSE